MRVRRKHIREITEQLLDDESIISPPVDVEHIAKNAGVKVVLEPAEDSLSGFLDRRGSTPIIGVNSTHSTFRKRFTIAHELGHHFLHSEPLFFDESVLRFRDSFSSQGKDVNEVEANFFAAELLMPKRFLEEDFEIIGYIDINNAEFNKQLEVLALKYKVSTQSLIYRLNYLELA